MLRCRDNRIELGSGYAFCGCVRLLAELFEGR